MSRPLISVVILTYNSERTIRQCLERVFNQRYRSYEVIAVDNGSTDRTLEILSMYPVKVVEASPLDTRGRLRNMGTTKAKGEIIAYIDSDMILVQDDWFDKMVKPFENPSVAVTRSLSTPYGNTLNRLLALYSASIKLPRIVSKEHYAPIGTGHELFRKKAVVEAGMFNEKIRVDEDFELFRRIIDLGYIAVSVDDAEVHHLAVDSLLHYMRKLRWMFSSISAGEAVLGRQRLIETAFRLTKGATIIVTFYEGIYRALRDRDRAWFLHPALEFLHVLLAIRYGLLNRNALTFLLNIWLSGG